MNPEQDHPPGYGTGNHAARDWRGMRSLASRLLREKTGADLEEWNGRILRDGPADEKFLRIWLAQRGVTGLVQSYLVVERFGYPDDLAVTEEELLDGQFADRPALRAVYDAILKAAASQGDISIHARKTHSLIYTPLRMFARVESPAPDRIDVHLRLDGSRAWGRLHPASDYEHLRVKMSLRSAADLDAEAGGWIREAYARNV